MFVADNRTYIPVVSNSRYFPNNTIHSLACVDIIVIDRANARGPIEVVGFPVHEGEVLDLLVVGGLG